MIDHQDANRETREAWNENAAFWDSRMGEGNDWVNVLVWPATERLLQLSTGERVLDVACGNGLVSRKLANLGGDVVAFDFAPRMISLARERTKLSGEPVTYLVLDATDEAALMSLGEATFDAAVCSMALFDMAEIDPLMRALAKLIKPGGRLVFSVLHPCFNNAHTIHVAELEDRDGEVTTRYSIKVHRYRSASVEHGAAIRGQPKPQLYFHRPLKTLLGVAFEVGFVMDGLEEPCFPPDHPPGSDHLSWGGNYSEIPPVMVVRMVLPRVTLNG